MKRIFRIIIKNLFNFLSKEENLTKLTGMFIKFFYNVAKQAKENKVKQN
ncbi:hypothetical protein HB162lentus_01060 [Mammaliicoccus lentus]